MQGQGELRIATTKSVKGGSVFTVPFRGCSAFESLGLEGKRNFTVGYVEAVDWSVGLKRL